MRTVLGEELRRLSAGVAFISAPEPVAPDTLPLRRYSVKTADFSRAEVLVALRSVAWLMLPPLTDWARRPS